MDRVAVERTCREGPTGGHPRPRARQSRFLLRGQAAGRAQEHGVEILTCDAHFEGLPGVVFIAKTATNVNRAT